MLILGDARTEYLEGDDFVRQFTEGHPEHFVDFGVIGVPRAAFDDDLKLGRLINQAVTVCAAGNPHDTFVAVDWTFTDDPEELERYVPPHQCDDCWDGVAKAKVALAERPDRFIGLGSFVFRRGRLQSPRPSR